MRIIVLSILAAFVGLTVSATEFVDSARQLDEVVVTGSNYAVGRNLMPYTVTTVDSARLEATGNTQLLSAVSGLVPSLFVTERNVLGFGVSNGGSGHIKMRGVGGDRASAVLMMVDGQPQFAGLYSHHVADFYGTESVERVEVLRGPASVLYGSNAMAGVVNVITRRPRENGVATTVTSQYGSYGTWISSLTNTVRTGRFSSLVSAGYDRTDGVRKHFDFKEANGYAKVGYEISDRWKVVADYSIMSFSGNDPVYPSLKGQEGVYHQKVIRGEASATAYNFYGSANGAVRAYYSYGNHFIHDPNYFHSLDDRLGVIAYQNFILWKGASATAGFDFDRYSGKIPVSGGKDHTQNPMATMQRKIINEYSPYATVEQRLIDDKIVATAGLRMANSDIFGTTCVPQGGVAVAPADGWLAKASVAKGYRNPSFRELYLYKFANPDLRPESMTNYEVSAGRHFGRLFSADVTFYLAKGSDLIQQTAALNENTGRFTNKGVEVALQGRPSKTLRLWATYSWLHSSVKDLTGAPVHQYCLGAGWDIIPRVHADATLKGVGRLYVAEDVALQNYATLDLRVTWQAAGCLQLFVNVDNLTDARYQINKGYPMPGATVMGGFRLRV